MSPTKCSSKVEETAHPYSCVFAAFAVSAAVASVPPLCLTDCTDDTFVYTGDNSTSLRNSQVVLTTVSTFWYESIVHEVIYIFID